MDVFKYHSQFLAASPYILHGLVLADVIKGVLGLQGIAVQQMSAKALTVYISEFSHDTFNVAVKVLREFLVASWL